MLGISRAAAHDLARRDQLPVPVIRVGRRKVVSKRLMVELLDAHKENAA